MRIDDHDENHARACAVFDAIKSGELVYRPLYTTGYVLSELVVLTLARADPSLVSTALERIRSSSRIQVLHLDASTFTHVCEEFHRYDDQPISFVDHMTGALAKVRDIDYVFTFDADHFRMLGLTAVPTILATRDSINNPKLECRSNIQDIRFRIHRRVKRHHNRRVKLLPKKGPNSAP